MNREPDKIDETGTKYWYDDNEEFHNDGYPAIIWENGDVIWCKHGKLHNENDPAIIQADDNKEWWIDGKEYSEEEFKQYKIKNFIYNDKE